jgi:putative hydrolase of the HAD superfamily
MKLFIFDMGGVVTQNVSAAPKIAKAFGISEDDFYLGAGSVPMGSSTSSYNVGDIGAIQRGSLNSSQFWENFAHRTGIKVDGDPWETYFKPIRDFETYQIIDDLKKAGYRVICGTNTLEAHFNVHKKRGDYDCFDKVYASHLMQVIKPHPDFWLHILKEEKTEPSEVFFIDDSKENVNAAAALGIHVHHFKNALALRKDLSDVI